MDDIIFAPFEAFIKIAEELSANNADSPDDAPWGGGTTTNNTDFDESKHPRAPDGKFGSGASSDKDVDTESRRDTVLSVKVRPGLRLSATEYGKVTHELNNNLTPEEREKAVVKRPVGDYMYTVHNNGFNEYTIVRKAKL